MVVFVKEISTGAHSMSDFFVGDVVVTTSGLGTITDIIEMTVYGETLEYYVIKNKVVGHLTEKVPVTSSAVRKPSTPRSLNAALSLLSKTKSSVRGNPDQLARTKRRALNSLKLSDVIGLVRDTYTPPKKEYTNAGIEFYEPALNRLAHEVAYVLEIPLYEAVERIEETLRKQHMKK